MPDFVLETLTNSMMKQAQPLLEWLPIQVAQDGLGFSAKSPLSWETPES